MSYKYIGFVTHEQVNQLTGKDEIVIFDVLYAMTEAAIKKQFKKLIGQTYMDDVNAETLKLDRIELY